MINKSRNKGYGNQDKKIITSKWIERNRKNTKMLLNIVWSTGKRERGRYSINQEQGMEGMENTTG